MTLDLEASISAQGWPLCFEAVLCGKGLNWPMIQIPASDPGLRYRGWLQIQRLASDPGTGLRSRGWPHIQKLALDSEIYF